MMKILRRQGMIYIIIVCLSQINICGINPIGIGMTAAAIATGYSIVGCILAMLLGIFFSMNMSIMYIYFSVVFTFGLLEYLFRKKNIKADEVTKSILFLIIYSLIKLIYCYQDLTFLNMLFIILEVLIGSCVCMVLSVGTLYISKRGINKSMTLPDKISLALMLTLLGVYVIQVRKENVTPLKIAILYALSFVVTLIYKSIIGMSNNSRRNYGNYSTNSFIRNRLLEYATAIRNMAKSINILSDGNMKLNIQQGNAIFERVSKKYCDSCDRNNICWNKEYESTYKAVNDIVNKGIYNGEVVISDLPRNFAIRCKNVNDFILETNTGLEIEKNNIKCRKQINEMKSIMSMQLLEMSNLLDDITKYSSGRIINNIRIEKKIRASLKSINIYAKDVYYFKNQNGINEMLLRVRAIGKTIVKTSKVAEEVSMILEKNMVVSVYSSISIGKELVEVCLVQKAKYSITTAYQAMKKEGEVICGDNYSILDDKDGETVMILSDGMGTGSKAFNESKKVVEMVEELFTAGFNKDIALKLVNSAMYLNYSDSNMYATADVCIIDKYKGECEFVKNGAAPTFIKRDREVYIVESSSLPMGVFDSTEFDSSRFRLNNGDIIIMITDGLEECMPKYFVADEEISYIIKNIDSNNPKIIANDLLRECVNNNIVKDDISVLVGIIWENKY